MFDDDLLKLKQISVSGTYTYQDAPELAERLGKYRQWLAARHPEAKLIIRTRFRPENYGHGKVTVVAQDKPTHKEAERRISIERMKIEDTWKEMVGW